MKIISVVHRSFRWFNLRSKQTEHRLIVSVVVHRDGFNSTIRNARNWIKDFCTRKILPIERQ